MNLRSAVFIVALLLLPTVSNSEPPALKFVKKIGVGWQTDNWGWMSFVGFSTDGKMVASDELIARADGYYSGSLILWSFPEGRLIKKLAVEPKTISGVSTISGNWKYYATSHGVGEMETGKKLISLAENVSAVYTFSPDSRYVAESLPGKGIHSFHIRIVELASGKQVSAFGSHGAFSLAISPDGVTLAAGHWDAVTLWNMLTGKRVAVLTGFGRYVEALNFSSDGKLLVAVTESGGFQVWDMERKTMLHSLALGGAHPSKPVFSPDGQLIAVGMYATGTAWLIDAHSGKALDHQKVSEFGCGSVSFSPDGRFLITPSTGGIITYSYDRGGTVRVFEVSNP
ncbi:MAG: hypothetical protein ABSC48_17515 [Terracidiphilus sp.]|jgi:WD40 repeat protein